MSDNNDSMNSNETETSVKDTGENTNATNVTTPVFIRPEELSSDENPAATGSAETKQDLTQNSTDNSNEPKKKKKKTGIIVGAVACVLILLLIVFSPKLKEVLSLSTQSPEEYFTSLVRTEVADGAKQLRTSMERQEALKNNKLSYNSNINITLGDYAKQILAAQGITINNMDMTMAIDMANNQLNASGMIGLNDTDLLSYLYLYDIADQTFFFKLPELSDAYLKLSTTTEANEEAQLVLDAVNSMYEILTGENTEKFLVDYSNVILDKVKNVELEEKQTLTVNDKTATCNKLTVNFSEKDLTEILIAVLEKASTDKSMRELVESFYILGGGDTEFNYDDISVTIEELKAELETAGTETILSISLYAEKDTVIGWIINVNDEEESVNFNMDYTNIKDKTDGTIAFHITDDDVEIITVTGDYQESNEKYSGNMDVVINTGDMYLDDYSTTSLTVSFSDVAVVNQETGTMQGTFNISTDASLGMNFQIVLNGATDAQSMELSISMMGQMMASIKFDTTKKEFSDFSMPSESDLIYDGETHIDEYSATLDIYSLLGKLSQAGFDLSSLLGMGN